MAFFKQPAIVYQPENRAVESVMTTVKQLVGTLTALQQTPAYQGAGAANASVLMQGLATLNDLLVDLEHAQADNKATGSTVSFPRLTQ